MNRLTDLTPDQWFWLRVRWLPDGCWEWGDFRNEKGYGQVRHDGRRVYAHRLSWELANGPIPEGMIACHHCDNPPCVRPDHLFLGTHADNAQDSVSKGRHAEQKRTHCGHGHPFTPENTYRDPKNGHRQCRTCRRLAARRHALRKRQNLSPGASLR